MKPWWRKSFTADIAEYLFHFPPAQTRAEAAEVLRRSRTRKGARVLDLACGVGRHKHIEKVYSFADLKSMLRRAGLRLETVWGDMAGGRFDPERSKLLTLLARKG